MTSNRLLIVDDEPDICDIVTEIANGVGFESRVAHHHQDFLTGVREFEPSVIVLDLNLPDVDGIELLRDLSANKIDAAILLISGQDGRVLASAQRLAVSHGLNVAGRLGKPIDLGALEERLNSLTTDSSVIDDSQIIDAVEGEQFVLHYQPKVRLEASGKLRIHSLEVLARWQHPRRGLLYPSSFIPQVERSTDLARSFTSRVFKTALKQLAIWKEEYQDLKLAINFPTCCLDDLRMPDKVVELITSHGLHPSDAIIELTETGAMEDVRLTMDVLTRLRLKGCNLSIDDMGTGYSSLLQLYRLPFNEMKIDQSFVRDVPNNDEATTLVRAMIDLGRHLGLKVCAEGVETAEALEFLIASGCDSAQGFYVSKPVSAQAMSEFLIANREGIDPTPSPPCTRRSPAYDGGR